MTPNARVVFLSVVATLFCASLAAPHLRLPQLHLSPAARSSRFARVGDDPETWVPAPDEFANFAAERIEVVEKGYQQPADNYKYAIDVRPEHQNEKLAWLVIDRAVRTGLEKLLKPTIFTSIGDDGKPPVLRDAWTDITSAINNQGGLTYPSFKKKNLAYYWSQLYQKYYQDIGAIDDFLTFKWKSGDRTATVTAQPLGFKNYKALALTTDYALPTALRSGTVITNKGEGEGTEAGHPTFWLSKVTHNAHLNVFKDSGGTIKRVAIRHGIIGYKIDDDVEGEKPNNWVGVATHLTTTKMLLKKALATADLPALPAFKRDGTDVGAAYRIVFNSLLVPTKFVGKSGDRKMTMKQHGIIKALRADLYATPAQADIWGGKDFAGVNPRIAIGQTFYDHTTPIVDNNRAILNTMAYAQYAVWICDNLEYLATAETTYAKVLTTNDLLKGSITTIAGTSGHAAAARKIIAKLGDGETYPKLFKALSDTAADVLTRREALDTDPYFKSSKSSSVNDRGTIKTVVRIARAYARQAYGTYLIFPTKIADDGHKLLYVKTIGAIQCVDMLLVSGHGKQSAHHDFDLTYEKLPNKGMGSGERVKRLTEDTLEAQVQYLLGVYTFANCKSGADRTSIFMAHHYAAHALLTIKYHDDEINGVIDMVTMALNADRMRHYVDKAAPDTAYGFAPAAIEAETKKAKRRLLFNEDITRVLLDKSRTAPNIVADHTYLLDKFLTYRNAMFKSYIDMSARLDFGATGVRGMKFEVNPNIFETLPVKVKSHDDQPIVLSERAKSRYMGSYQFGTNLGNGVIQDLAIKRGA